jgi:CheY-like chemotaxis protein
MRFCYRKNGVSENYRMNPLKVLLVDDSRSARYALRLQLQQHNVTVETADAAESALDRIRESPPDVIFMDHTMPGMSGFEALDILKSGPSTAHIPVVMCTSHEEPEFIAQAKKKGALDTLSKAAAQQKLGGLIDRLQRLLPSPEGIVASAGETGPVARKLTETVPGTGVAATDEGLAGPVRALIESLIDERAETLANELIAKMDKRIASRVSASTDLLMEGLSQRLTDELTARIDERLASSLDAQVELLKEQLLATLIGREKPRIDRLLKEELPTLMREYLEQEREDLTLRVRKSVDASLNSLAEEPRFLHRVADNVKASVGESTVNAAKRQATQIAEAITGEWANTIAGHQEPRPEKSGNLIYLLSAGAALVGGTLVAAVIFLFS